MHRMLQGDTLTPSLPDDIIFDILSRLPVRSVTRFKSVCKCWHSLIRSRIFIEMHLRSGLQTIDRLQLWFSVHPRGFSLHYRKIVKSMNFVTQENVVWLAPSSSPDLYSLFLPPHYYHLSHSNFFMGSCNGLLCFYLPASMALKLQAFMWNPATGTFRFMSEDDVSAVDVCDKTLLKLKVARIHSHFGFGYDSSIDDYKIVRLVQYINRESLLVDLLTVGGNKLRRFQFPLSAGIRSTVGVLLHGSLHWLMCRQFSEYFILRLNLGTENFDELIVQLPHPPHKEEADDTSMIRCVKDLSVVDGKLYVVVEYVNYKDDYVLWVMEEYGVETSWTKRFSRSLFVCDPKERTYQNISLPYPWTKEIMDSRLVYVESLVSPFHVPNPNWRFEE